MAFSDPLIPREELFQPPEIASVKISPDGTKLVYVGSTKEGILNIHLCNQIDSIQNATALTDFNEPSIKQFYFSSDSKKIVFLKDTNGNQLFHLYTVDLATKKLTDLTKDYDQIVANIYKVSELKNQAVIGINDRNSSYHDIYLINLDTGEKRLLLTNNEFHQFLFDDQLNLIYKNKINLDGSIEVFDGEDDRLFYLSAEDAFHTKLIDYDSEKGLLYFLDTQDSNTTTLKTLNRNEEQKIIANDPKSDINELIFQGNDLIAYATEYLEKKWHVVDAKYQKHFDNLAKEVGSSFSLINKSSDGQTWIVKTSTPLQAVQIFLYDCNEEKAYLLTHYLAKRKLANMHPFITKSRDGMDLLCYLTLPPSKDHNGKTKEPVPLVIFPHGGPFQARDTKCFHPWHQWLANRGYAVLSVNFRLSSGLGKELVNRGNGQWGRKSQEDLIDAANWCIKNGITTKDQIAIFGGSYGGYSALAGITFTPDYFKCSIAICGPSNLKTILDHVPIYWDFPTTRLADTLASYTKGAFIKSMGGNPETQDGIEELQQRSPLNFVHQIKKPLLLIHGDLDRIVAKSESDQIFEKMKQENKQVTYLRFPDEGHHISRFCNTMIYLAYAEKILADNLGGKYQPINEEDLENSNVIIQKSECEKSAVK